VAPLLRQKQLHAKNISHIIDVNLTTIQLERIDKTLDKLQLLHRLIREEIDALAKRSGIQVSKKPIKNDYFAPIANDVVIFYDQDQFMGNVVRLTYGFYDYPNVGGIGNHAVGSFKIPDNVIVHLYTLPKKTGTRLKYIGPTRVARLPAEYRHRISGVEIVKDKPAIAALCYTGQLFQGTSVALPPGFYDYPDVGGIGTKRLASFRLPPQLMMTIYTRPNREGDKVTYKGPMDLTYFPPGLAGNISGMEIQMQK
jgi:hypothetical protein